MTRVTFTAPDGTEYEFRDEATNGQPKAPVSGGFNRGTIFTTADGTTATFISDWTIYETAYGLEPPAPDGYIKLKDGTQFPNRGPSSSRRISSKNLLRSTMSLKTRLLRLEWRK